MNGLELDDLGLELPCAQCGNFYRLPLKTVTISRQMLHEGCPLADERECAPLFYGSLLAAVLVNAPGDTLAQLGKQARGADGRVVLLAQ